MNDKIANLEGCINIVCTVKKRRLRHLQMHLKKIRHQEMRLKQKKLPLYLRLKFFVTSKCVLY